MTEHSIELNGKAHVLRYTMSRSVPLVRLVTGKRLLDAVKDGHLEEQAAVVVAGLPQAHGKKPLSKAEAEALVGEVLARLDELREADGPVAEVFLTAMRALGDSGVTGTRFDVDESGEIQNIRPVGKDARAET
jgi:hypothetical protein